MVLAVSSALQPYNNRAFKTAPAAYRHNSVSSSGDVPVLRQDSNIGQDGHYSYQYELGNGISASESGVGGQNVQGSYQYTSPEGEPISITYTADENGYQAHGSHVPEIPPYILRSLEYIRTHTYVDKYAAASSKSYSATPSPTRAVFKAPVAKTYKAPAKTAYRAPSKIIYKSPAKSTYKAPAKTTVYNKAKTARRF